MNVTGATYYCLPNRRCPFVLAYEPHPWGCGALRVREDRAILLGNRLPTAMEIDWLATWNTYCCVTFATEAVMLDWEDGQMDNGWLVEACHRRRDSIEAVLREVEAKRAKHRVTVRRRQAGRRPGVVSLPLVGASS